MQTGSPSENGDDALLVLEGPALPFLSGGAHWAVQVYSEKQDAWGRKIEMSKRAFDKMMEGLEDAIAYTKGDKSRGQEARPINATPPSTPGTSPGAEK